MVATIENTSFDAEVKLESQVRECMKCKILERMGITTHMIEKLLNRLHSDPDNPELIAEHQFFLGLLAFLTSSLVEIDEE